MASITYTPVLTSQPYETTVAVLSQVLAAPVAVDTGGDTSGAASTDSVTLALNTIPVAQPGHIITSEYHNSLRTAVLLIASRLGIDTTGASGSQTYPPQFLTNGTGPNWTQTAGLATAGSDGANGFFPLLLPDGTRLQSLRVRGRRAGTVSSFQVQLVRVDIASGTPITLISASSPATDPFDVTQNLSVSGAGTAALEEYRTVVNSTYTYLIIATANGLDGAGPVAQINSITVNFSPT